MHNVLVLGGSGLIGKAIISEMNKNKEFQIYGTYFENPLQLNQGRNFKLNIEDSANISSILKTVRPHIVISCLRGNYYKQLILKKSIRSVVILSWYGEKEIVHYDRFHPEAQC